MLTYSRQQKQRQRRRSRQNRSRNVLPQLCQHRKMHRDRHRKHLVCARMIYDCALNRKRRSIRQPQHHKSLDGVLLFSKRQKIPQKHLFGSRCQIVHLYPMHRQPRNRRACAQKMCAHARTCKSRKVPPRQQCRNRDDARLCGRQRNPAQKKRRRRIFIQSHQKFASREIFPSVSRRASVKSQRSRSCAERYRLSRRQRKHRTFSISSRPARGHRVPLNHLPYAAKSRLSENAQRTHRRIIYRPCRRRRHGKYLRKSKRSSLKIHLSNPSIHPNRLAPYRRSRLFQMHPRPRQSASRSRLAAANRFRLSSRRHRHRLHQRSSCPPSVKNRNQTPHREKNPGAAFPFGQRIRSRSALQKHSQKRLYQKLIQSVREKRQRRTHNGRCLKRAIPARQEQPLWRQRSWVKRQQKRQKN